MNRRLIALALLLLAGAAHAHTETSAGGGFTAGFLHPFSGGDHLLAMVGVGMWGAALGAPLVWLLPVAFPLLMVAGAVLAIAGVPLPGVEHGVALSVLVLGLAVACAWKAPLPVAVAIVGAFGLLHGHAHGVELPASALPAAYASGFVLASGLLHGAGIGIGSLQALPAGRFGVRATGWLVGVAGAWMLVGRPGLA